MNVNSETDASQSAMKTKRDQFAYEIRKKKNDTTLNLKRMKFTPQPENPQPGQITLNSESKSAIDMEALAKDFRTAIQENNIVMVEKVLEMIRHSISVEDTPNVEPLYKAQILPQIADFITKERLQYQKVQFEAAWILTNVASSDYTKYVVATLQGIDRFMLLLDSPSAECRNMAIFGLANIAGEDVTYSQIMLEKGLVSTVVKMVDGHTLLISELQEITWLFSNLSKGKPYPPFELLAPALPTLERLLVSNDKEILSNVLWTIANLADHDEGAIECIMDMEGLDIVLKLSMEDEGKKVSKLRTPALKIIGCTVASEDDKPAVKWLEYGVMKSLILNLNVAGTLKFWRKETLWTISNYLACGSDMVEEVFKNPEVLVKIVHLLYNDPPDIKAEAMKCLLQAAKHGAYQQIEYMVENEIIKVILDFLIEKTDADILIDALDTLSYIFESGESYATSNGRPNPYLISLEREEGVKIIETLQNHPDERVHTLVARLIDDYFLPE